MSARWCNCAHALHLDGMCAAKTVNERKADERARKRAAGYVLRQFWVHPKDWERVQKCLERVNRLRER